jgi:hypothetical protein
MSSSRRSKSRRWKRLFANLVVVALGVVALLLLVGLFLPRSYRLQRTVEIRAKPEVVYTQIATLREWPEWTVWNRERDPGVRFEFEGPDVGEGAAYRWTGATLGVGQLKLTRAETNRVVEYQLEFDGGKLTATGQLSIEPTEAGVKVIWVNEGDLGRNPVGRYFGLFMERLMGPDFEGSLSRLKGRVEGASVR